MAALLVPTDADRRAAAPTIATFHHAEFSLEQLYAAKTAQRATIGVLIPARDEQATIGEIVRVVREELMEAMPLVDELLVVDDASMDETAAVARAHGASVVPGPGLGKGEAMAAALAALRPLGPHDDDGLHHHLGPHNQLSPGALIVFLDGDVLEFGARFVSGLLGPLLCHAGVDFVKGCYRRPLGAQPYGGGRVTELVAKPSLALFFPELAEVDQPLAGETAMRASLLSEIELSGGYAVEVAMLIDAYELRGPSAIAQVDLGERRHRNRSLAELVPQATAVLGTVIERAGPRSPVPRTGT
ncbi:MAG: glycosyltransferase [Acidimicrobiales bacterium]